MLSDSEIAKAAEVQIYKGVYYDPKNLPIEGGLLDPRMVLKTFFHFLFIHFFG